MAESNPRLDLSLDDIIKTNPRKSRGGGDGGGGRGGGRGGQQRQQGNNNNNRGNNNRGSSRGSGPQRSTGRRGNNGEGRQNRQYHPYARDESEPQRVTVQSRPQQAAPVKKLSDTIASHSSGSGSGTGTKILVSNLSNTVIESEVEELFASVGPLISSRMHYDRLGNSAGSAEVVFVHSKDADNAISMYHGVELDNLPMTIVKITETKPILARVGGRQVSEDHDDGFGGARISVFGSSRIITDNAFTPQPLFQQHQQPRQQQQQSRPLFQQQPQQHQGHRGGNAGRGRGGNGGRGGRQDGGNKRPLTQEELDAQLESYYQ